MYGTGELLVLTTASNLANGVFTNSGATKNRFNVSMWLASSPSSRAIFSRNTSRCARGLSFFNMSLICLTYLESRSLTPNISSMSDS